MPREPSLRYDDPLDLIWLCCAREVGLQIRRSDDVFAAFDGQGTLTLSTPEHFDPDDSLAQLILHELCHGLVAGPRGTQLPDWGMENADDRDLVVEHACHRLQAKLADQHGLRGLFGVTTEHRPYWDALPTDPLAPGTDPAIPLAREAFVRARHGPWAKPLREALERTAHLAAVVRACDLEPSSLWGQTRPIHDSGFPLGDDPHKQCQRCAWCFRDGKLLRCRKTRAWPRQRGVRIRGDAQACNRFEPRLDGQTCAACGACCHEGFDRVEVGRREPVRTRHPELIAVDGFGAHLPRPRGRCVALEGDPGPGYRCRIYPDRPRACRDLAVGSDACLAARRRAGLSS